MNIASLQPSRNISWAFLAAFISVAGISVAHAQAQLAPNPSPPPLVNLTSILVDDAPVDQFDPHVDGPLIAYTKATGATTMIWYFRVGVDTTPQPVPVGSSDQDLLPRVSGPFITFSRLYSDRTAVMLFDTTKPAGSSNPYEIDARPGVFRFGAVMGASTVAFVGYALSAAGAVLAWDADAPQQPPTQLAPPGTNGNVAISPDGNTIVWQACPAGSFIDCDIWKAVRSGSTWTSAVVSADPANEEFPDTDGSRIVYDSARPASNVYFRDASGTEYQLALGGAQTNAHIAGDFITFESRANAGVGMAGDILLYQFSTNRLWNLTNVAQGGLNSELDDVTVLPSGELIVVYDTDEYGPSQRTVHALRFGVPASADATPPSISIATPADGALYLINSPLTAIYSCADADSGVKSCQGPVASGAAVPTTTAGPKSFTVNALDNAGNASSASAGYVIGYAVSPRYDQTQAKKSGSAYPIRVALLDALGRNVSSDAVVVHAVGVTQVSTNAPGALSDAGNANPDLDFRFDAATGTYLFNLKTTGFATGTYALGLTAGADPNVHAALFQIK